MTQGGWYVHAPRWHLLTFVKYGYSMVDMDVFLFSLNAIMPIILLSALGFVLRKVGFFTADFLSIANAFCFRFTLPALLFINVYNIENFQDIHWDIVLFVGSFMVATFLMGLVYVCLCIKNPLQKGVLLQTVFRSNYIIIGIPLAFSLGGSEGGAIASVLSAFTVPLFNILAVIALTIFLPRHNKAQTWLYSVWVIIRKILTNPLILATVAAFLCLLIRPYLDGWRLKTGELSFLFVAIENVSRIASPLALIVLGGEFTFSAVKVLLPKIIQGLVIRLVIVPLLGIFLVFRFFPHFGAAEHAALLVLFASPSAVSSAIMAQQMGNDGELARQLVVWTSIGAAFTLFAFTAVLRSMGVF